MSRTKTHVDTPDLRVLDKETGFPLAPTPQPGYYAGFSTMAQRKFWETATRNVVETRVSTTPERRFFTEVEWTLWTAVFDHLLPQTDRTPDRQIPLVAPLDERLYKDETDGYRFQDMPTDREAYRLGVEAIHAEAEERFGRTFLLLTYLQQEQVLEALREGKPEGAAKIWKRMSVHRFWELIMTDAIKAYYAHPWSWDEIGFGGPAYPRAYTRLERGEPEPWEVEERRYAWTAPSVSLSDNVEIDTEHQRESQQRASQPGAGAGSDAKRSR